jgi:predicted MFS family arabinose efflux permease
MLHNTLQTNATQMLPEARGTAVAGFSSSLFLGQSVGVAMAAPLISGGSAVAVFVAAAVLWPIMAYWMARRLVQHRARL